LCVFSPNNTSVLLMADKVMECRDLESGQLLPAPPKQHNAIQQVSFSPNGKLLAVGCSDTSFDEEKAVIWNMETGKAMSSFQHRDGILGVVFSPDGTKLATSSEDFSAMIWDTKSAVRLVPPLSHLHQVHQSNFSPDGKWLVTACHNGMARVWDVGTGEPLTPPLMQPELTWAARFVAGNKKVLTESRKQTVRRVWELPRESRPIEQLSEIAELLSAQQTHDSGAALYQTKERLEQLWSKLRATYPEQFSISRK
jgi:WD40 repeat protein